ncbi:hypothetical protein ACFSUD_08180 [Sulfitobacter aestuarii]|uniref:Flagellar assembly protein FliH n=1 Tax=Sulfitobacter aestuarii TaxID=2161676 RepID=A0ABW5U2Z4_9RHOB
MSLDCFFDRNFDAEIEAEAAARARSETATQHSSEALAAAVREAAEAARQEGYAAGHEAGLTAARAEIAARQTELAEQLLARFGDLLADRQEHQQRLETEMTGFVHDICAKVFPELGAAYGSARVSEEIARIIRRAVGSPSLDIRVAPDMALHVRAALARLEPDEGRKARVIPDATLAETDVEATWQNGRSHYSFEATCKAILQLLAAPEISQIADRTHR